VRFDVLRFPSHAFDPQTGVATFDYLLDGPEPLTLTETITFPVPADRRVPETFRRVLELLHVVAGVSYYNVAAPPRVIAPAPVPPAAAELYTAVYTHGMAEYAYRNQLPHVLDQVVEVPGTSAPAEPVDNATARPLSPVGGGKDSIVTLETLRSGGLDPVPFSINPNPLLRSVLTASGLPALTARRQLDPRLFELNRAGARNGHIPVTAINSLIAIAAAAWHGLGPVVMSNERSASDPNLIWNGHEINHQWSKGVLAEGLLRQAVTAHAGLTEPYFSLLRQLSELHIAQLYARHHRYDASVTSCNQAFKLHDPTARWCGDCPKCRFVFLAMAPAIGRDRLTGIFGKDLFADESQVPGFLELLGIDGHKPFECVGEVEESLVALSMLDDDAPVLVALRARVPAEAWAAIDRQAVLTPSGPHFIPAAYAKILDATL
jgi:UDP-N-acetyl-alpha-D-muramoyl-L-alanyl-L-glutamate epimerase